MAAHPPRQQPASGMLRTPTEHSPDAVAAVSGVLNTLLADTYALFLKTKNFHWHVSGPHFREYHLLFEEQAEEILKITDLVAERVRMLGGATIREAHKVCDKHRDVATVSLLEEWIDQAEKRVWLLFGTSRGAAH